MLSQLPIKQAIQQIKNLINEQKLVEAHRACFEILRYDSENITVIHLKNKIEKIVKKINRSAVKLELLKLKPLWRERKHEELLLNLKKLEPYIPYYPRLKKIIIKAKKCYEIDFARSQETLYEESLNAVRQLMEEKKFQEAILAVEKLLSLKIHVADLKKLAAQIRKRCIEDELKQNSFLLQSEKYEDILFFYQKLLRIDPYETRIHNLVERTKKIYQRYRIEEKQEFIYTSLEKIRTLYQRKKYEKSLEASLEILDVDPKNKTAQFFWRNSLKKVRRLIDSECGQQMIAAWKELGEQYKKDKKAFIRI